MDKEKIIADYWIKFLTETKRDPSLKYFEASYFGDNEKLAKELLDLILKGEKTATTSCVLSYEKEGERLPKVGDLSIITNWANEPKGIIETTAVLIMPFKDMTFDICKREGEDECLETWIKGHKRFFADDGKKLGYEFDDDTLIIFEDFELIYS